MDIVSGIAGVVALICAGTIMYTTEHKWIPVILVIYSLAFHIAAKGM